jgi:rhodanese-related sulfurtransferase
MGFLAKLFGVTDINEALKEVKSADGAILVDVRNADEYASGRVPGAINIAVDRILDIKSVVSSKDAPIYTYCLTGRRSGRAVAALKSAGYTNVRNIGGINSYRGPKEN